MTCALCQTEPPEPGETYCRQCQAQFPDEAKEEGR